MGMSGWDLTGGGESAGLLPCAQDSLPDKLASFWCARKARVTSGGWLPRMKGLPTAAVAGEGGLPPPGAPSAGGSESEYGGSSPSSSEAKPSQAKPSQAGASSP